MGESVEVGAISTADRQLMMEINRTGVPERSTIKDQCQWKIGEDHVSVIRTRMGGGALEWEEAPHMRSGVSSFNIVTLVGKCTMKNYLRQ